LNSASRAGSGSASSAAGPDNRPAIEANVKRTCHFGISAEPLVRAVAQAAPFAPLPLKDRLDLNRELLATR
jgi:hypothetical protein